MTPFAHHILAVLLSFRVYAEDADRAEDKRIQLRSVAESIATYAESDAEAALVIASGWEESGFQLRIHEGRCREEECDHGRARGPWQLQRDGMSQESWDRMVGVENVDAQVRTVVKRIRFYRMMCGDTPGTIARYFGLGCKVRTKGVYRRFATYRRILVWLRSKNRST